jgi:hypothetical protein
MGISAIKPLCNLEGGKGGGEAFSIALDGRFARVSELIGK